MDPSTGKALRMPELLAGVLRFLGPLDWLKCGAVCSWWSATILHRDDEDKFVSAAAAAAAAVAGDATPGTRTINPDFWHEFAISTMGYRDLADSSGNSGTAKKSIEYSDLGSDCKNGSSGARYYSSPGAHARGPTSLGTNTFYMNVCLEGNPAVLGPPLRAMASWCDLHVATVRSKDVVAASIARSRKPRALIKFLSLWATHGRIFPAATGDRRRARMTTSKQDVQFTYPFNFGRKGAKGCSAALLTADSTALSAKKRKALSRKKSAQLPSTCAATAMVNDGLGVFTRLFGLCGRCRRPRTTLYASKDCRNAPLTLRTGGAHRMQNMRPMAAAAVLPIATTIAGPDGEGPTLWIECQEEGCGITSEVATDTSSPRWLTKFAEYVLLRTWEDINTIAADHGTEWFSDTSPEAVQRRQEEARANSLGLDALARNRHNSDEEKV